MNSLSLNNVSIGYTGNRGGRKLVKDGINLSALQGELVALIGGNGIGKSTLLRTISGFQKSLGGEILVKGKSVDQYREDELSRIMSFVSTEIIKVSNLSVFELVALGRFPHTNWFGRLSADDSRIVHESIEMVGLSGYENRMINHISDGERQRAMIARTLAQDTDIIVLDEPTAFLDVPNKYETVNILHKLAREKNKTIIFSTHDLNIAIGEADLIWLFLTERVGQGAPEDLILQGVFPKLFEQSGLYFDMEKGDFRINRVTGLKITLEGNGAQYNWTKKALERNGITVSRDNETDQLGKLIINNGNIELIIDNNPDEKPICFDSIYNLCNYLKNLSPRLKKSGH